MTNTRKRKAAASSATDSDRESATAANTGEAAASTDAAKRIVVVGADGAAGASGSSSAGQEDVAGTQEQTEPVTLVDTAAELDRLKAERDEYYANWMRERAELENFRKRTQREMEQHTRYSTASLVQDLLPVLDNIYRALDAARQSKQVEDLLTGVEMTVRQFEDALAKHRAVPIEAVGLPFDPSVHEAVQQLPSAEHPPMTVLHEVERGFKVHDRVVRPSKVVVSTAPAESEQDSAES